MSLFYLCLYNFKFTSMSNIKLFESKQIRSVWNDDEKK